MTPIASSPQLARRIFLTVGVLLAYRLGCQIPVRGLDGETLHRLVAGGRLTVEHLSIFALGVVPIFSALIIFEFLKLVVPALDRWEKSDNAHVAQLQRYILAAALIFAAFQAEALARAFEGVSGLVIEPGWEFHAFVIATLVAATALLSWAGDRITLYGIGDGFWLLLLTPYAINLPNNIGGSFELWRRGEVSALSLLVALAFLVCATVLVVMAYNAQSQAIAGRRTPAGLRRSGTRVSGADFAIVWPPLLANYGAGAVFAAILLFAHGKELVGAHALILSDPVRFAILGALLVAIAYRQHRSAAADRPSRAAETKENVGAGGAWRPELTMAMAQIIVTLGAALLTRLQDLPFAINGGWLFIAGAAVMNCIVSAKDASRGAVDA